MNDFTKEELKALQSWGEVYTQFGACWTTMLHEPLLNKLQSLIANYDEPPECEHEPMLIGQSTDHDYIPEMSCVK